jgi:hypothetical protein
MKFDRFICESLKVDAEKSEAKFLEQKEGVNDEPGKFTASKIVSIIFDDDTAKKFIPGRIYSIQINSTVID